MDNADVQVGVCVASVLHLVFKPCCGEFTVELDTSATAGVQSNRACIPLVQGFLIGTLQPPR